MKKSILLAVSLLTLAAATMFSQETSAPAAAEAAPVLTRFNLDFAGGTPAQLVEAIEKATGKPLNAIIPTEDAAMQLPPLKMNNVDVVQLFAALGAASNKTVPIPGSSSSMQIDYGFTTPASDESGGPPRVRRRGSDSSGKSNTSDDFIWYFYTDLPMAPVLKQCQFFSLAPYLDRGFTVDDITTAIRTGWDMQAAGEAESIARPQISFHKETKMLIAVGQPYQLQIIEQALNALRATTATVNDLDKMNKAIAALQKQVDQLKSLHQIPARIPAGQ